MEGFEKRFFVLISSILLFAALFAFAVNVFEEKNKGEEPEIVPINPEIPESPPKNDFNNNLRCGIESCHGLEIKCGPNIPEVCTMVYMPGDKCRRFARCEVIEGECSFVPTPEFEACKSCVEECIEKFGNSEELMECESKC